MNNTISIDLQFLNKPYPTVFRKNILDELISSFNMGKRICFLTAPAGYGKSSVLVQIMEYIRTGDSERKSKSNIVFINLKNEDIDLKSFVRKIHMKFQKENEEFCSSISQFLNSPLLMDIDHVAFNILNEISLIEEKTYLIFDNYHIINSEQIHQFIHVLLEFSPENLFILIASRSDPQLPINSYRLKNKLIDFRLEDFAFTPLEIQIYFSEIINQPINQFDAEILYKKTEGWIISLQLFGSALKKQTDISKAIKEFSGTNRFIIDYLMDQVQESLSPKMITLLMVSSVLPRFNSFLIDFLIQKLNIEDVSGEQFIDFLTTNNLFIISLDDSGEWFRYQNVFKKLLFKKCILQGYILNEIYLMVFHWMQNYVNQVGIEVLSWGYINDLINIGCQIPMFDEVKLIIKQYGDDMIWQGNYRLLWQWIQELPLELVQSDSRIFLYQTFLLCFKGEVKTAAHNLKIVKINESDIDQDLGVYFTIKALLAIYFGDIESMRVCSLRALDLLPQDDLRWRCVALSTYGDALSWMGDLSQSEMIYLQTLLISNQTGNIFFAVHTGIKVITNLLQRGQLRQVNKICIEQIEIIKKHHLEHSAYAGAIYALQSIVYNDWYQLSEADNLSKLAVEICTYDGNKIMLGISLLARLEVLKSCQNKNEFETIFLQLIRLQNQPGIPVWLKNWISGWEIKVDTFLGRFHHFDVDKKINQFLGENISYLNLNEYIAVIDFKIKKNLSRISETVDLIQEITTDQIIGFLQKLYDQCVVDGLIRQAINILVLMSILLDSENNSQSLQYLEKALVLAEREKYSAIIINEGNLIINQLKVISEKIPENEFIQSCINQLEKIVSSNYLMDVHSKDLLTTREIEVLLLIAEGYSNAEIAGNLFLSIDTVKGHTRRIYQKLFVNRRTQAVNKAKALGYI